MSDWQETLLPLADRLYRELHAEGFSPQRIKHVSNALHRRACLGLDGENLRRWLVWFQDGKKFGSFQDFKTAAAVELDISVEDIDAIMDGTLKCGPTAFRRIGRALAKCRSDLE